MHTGYRFRCYPSKAQAQVLLRWIGCQRYLYNAKVREDRYFRRFQRTALALAGQQAPIDQQYSHFKNRELTPWLFDVPTQVLRNGAVLWKRAYSRYFQDLGGKPTLHRKRGRQSVWLTNELFQFRPAVPHTTGQVAYQLMVGTRKFPVGRIAFRAHRAHPVPASITFSVDHGRWYLSFNVDDGAPQTDPQRIAARLALWPHDALSSASLGVKRSAALSPLCTSAGQRFDFPDVQKQRLAKKEQARSRWQRAMARRVKGSNGWRKARKRIAGYQQYAQHVLHDFAHQTSHRLVTDDAVQLIAFEEGRPVAANGPSGRGGARLGRSFVRAPLAARALAGALNKTRDFTRYKALRQGKLVVDVDPIGAAGTSRVLPTVRAIRTSQACGSCGCALPGNRSDQAAFTCPRCGYDTGSDTNAARMVARRAVAMILSGNYAPKQKKRTMQLRTRVGVERPEPLREPAITPMEIVARRDAGNCDARRSRKSEATVARHAPQRMAGSQ
ncbi:MAG: transposase [Candidimonas sp.]|nr:MAG: transposase [Candidimonas sp.]